MRKKIKKFSQYLNKNTKKFINNLIWKKINKFFLAENLIVPYKFYKNIDDFKTKYYGKYNYIKLFEQTKLSAIPVMTLNNELTGNFKHEEFVYPEDYILELHNGKIYGETGLCITPNNMILDSINLLHMHIGGIEKNEIFNKLIMPEIKYVKGNVAVLTSLFSNFYYHWMLDIIPKFYMLEKSDLNIDYYVINSQDLKFQVETLQKIGIPKNKIIKTHKNLYIQAENLIIPSIPGLTGYDPEWAVNFIRKTFLDERKKENYPKRIYLNRKNAFSRRFVNKNEVEEILENYGFKEIFLDEMPIEEQACIFYNAKVIFSPHGGALTNLVFAQKASKLIEIFSPSMPIPCYRTLANMMGIKYYHIMADCPKGIFKTPNGKFSEQDIIADTKILEETIKLALSD